MLSPGGGSTDRLEIPPDARLERLQRRVAALERQLDARIAQVEELRHRLDDQERLMGQVDVLQSKAGQYDALMRTFTMRALSRPRAWYAAARRRLRRR